MIYYKEWAEAQYLGSGRQYLYQGWYLFGFIPLYIRRTGT